MFYAMTYNNAEYNLDHMCRHLKAFSTKFKAIIRDTPLNMFT